MNLLEKIKKASTIKLSSILEDSKLFNDVDETPTEVLGINIALSASITGGLKSGILTIAGPSRHFKSMYGLIMASAYLKKNKEAVLLFYDSEFGSPKEYFTSVGIDPKRVIHTPVTNLEELKFDIMQQLDGIERGDKVMIMIDSIGNLASKKEVDDAEAGKSVADMTRAKYLKGFYRIITPHLRIKDIPLVQIAHIYLTQDMFPKAVVSGGCLVEGTKLIMYDGSLKNIENIVVGEMVQTMSGPMPVTHTWTPETLETGEPECIEVTFEDGFSVTCSENHPFLIDGKWVEAKNISENDEITTI